MRLILVYLSINPSSSQIFGESLNPIHKDIVFYLPRIRNQHKRLVFIHNWFFRLFFVELCYLLIFCFLSSIHVVKLVQLILLLLFVFLFLLID